ncbi:MAG: hypothetical protein DYG89_32910 [Caldilinea sp. CFX5]|nr:hypothetical protein [Caldilinea sp. CFX5]
MQSLTTIKDKSQQGWNRLVEAGKQQPEERKVWGVTIAAAVAGGVVLAAVSKGVLAVVSTLAAPPVALTVGALAGGAVGWSLMQNQPEAPPSVSASTPVDTVPTAEAAA